MRKRQTTSGSSDFRIWRDEYTVSSRSCIVPTCQMHQDERAQVLCGGTQCYTLGHFTFCLSLLLRLLLNPKVGQRPMISQKVKSFFVWTWRSLSLKFDVRDHSAISWYQGSDWPIAEVKANLNSPFDFVCTRSVSMLQIEFRWAKIYIQLNQNVNKNKQIWQ